MWVLRSLLMTVGLVLLPVRDRHLPRLWTVKPQSAWLVQSQPEQLAALHKRIEDTKMRSQRLFDGVEAGVFDPREPALAERNDGPARHSRPGTGRRRTDRGDASEVGR